MDIDLRFPYGEQESEEDEANGIVGMLDNEEKPNLDGLEGNIGHVEEKMHAENGVDMRFPIADMLDPEEDILLEPLAGMEFESHAEAYAFYQEYARSMGFNTAIQNSRRSKTSKEFIDAKFACSRYGTKREYEKSSSGPRSRQENKLDQESGTARRACGKTDCKASMHVKRRSDGKWIIHRFEKEHNHELLPAQAVSEQTRRMYAAMARQFAEYKNVVGLKNDTKGPFDKCQNLAMDAAEAKVLLEFFAQMQAMNSNFFYAVDVSEDLRLRNLLWVDAKSRYDYRNFSDVVSFDTTYVRNKYKMPLALFVGVNQHYQFMLLGCALVCDESAATFSWVFRTWLRAMGGQVPKTVITDQDKIMKSVISEIMPSAHHYFHLWHIIGRVSDSLTHVIKHNDEFMIKFQKCIYQPRTDEEFQRRWQKLVERFELRENDLLQSLYEDRRKWSPTFMVNAFLAGMSTNQRSDSVNSFFDKYVHKKTTVQEFVKQFEAILRDRYEEKANADSEMWNKQPALKSPSPFERFAAGVYTHAVFKKFQNEVLGSVACIPKKEKQDGSTVTFRVQDFEKNQEFIVTLNELNSDVSCICHLFEFKGILCRHSMIVLQICGVSTIPSQYILGRWTKDAKNRYPIGEEEELVQSRMHRYNDLCHRAINLGEEGSLSQEGYNLVRLALDEAFGNCVGVNNSNKNSRDPDSSDTPGLLGIEDDDHSRSMNKTNKKKNAAKKRKVALEQDVMTSRPPERLQQMEKINSRSVTVDGYFGPTHGVQGMVQLNLMAAPTHDNYYPNQQMIHGLGQLNTIAPTHNGYYGTQPTMQGLGQMDFLRTPNFTYSMRQEEPNVRSAQLHNDTSRHA